jgi:hypothetical protein
MAKKKEWSEAELIKTFRLERKDESFPLLVEWLDVSAPQFNSFEHDFFEDILQTAKKKADFWNEETLKMRFISPLLTVLVHLDKDAQDRYEGFFDETISATVEGIYLQTETDFMLAKGIGDIAETPYFHFQEYKRSRKSPPEPMAQLIEAFLIAQEKNKNGKPLYGLTIVGRNWQFVVMDGRKYGLSRTFDATLKEDLLQIIAVLRKFKVILETTLLD